MTWNPATAYANEHQFMDFVEDAIWEEPQGSGLDPVRTDGFKVREEDINNPDYISLAVGIGIVPSTTVFCCWPPVADSEAIAFDPRPGHVLIVGDDETRWVVESQKQSVFGRWNLICNLEPINADS